MQPSADIQLCSYNHEIGLSVFGKIGWYCFNQIFEKDTDSESGYGDKTWKRTEQTTWSVKQKINKTKQINKTSRNLVIKPLSENVIQRVIRNAIFSLMKSKGIGNPPQLRAEEEQARKQWQGWCTPWQGSWRLGSRRRACQRYPWDVAWRSWSPTWWLFITWWRPQSAPL